MRLGTQKNPRSLEVKAINACRDILNYGGRMKVIFGRVKVVLTRLGSHESRLRKIFSKSSCMKVVWKSHKSRKAEYYHRTSLSEGYCYSIRRN